MPAIALNDRVAWLLLEGTVEIDDETFGRGALLYCAMLTEDPPLLLRTELALVSSDVRALAFRADDFFELCLEDPELAELLRTRLDDLLALQKSRTRARAGTVVSEVMDAPSDAVNEFITEETSLGGTVTIKRAPTVLESHVAVEVEQAAKAMPAEGDSDGEVTQLGALPKPPVPAPPMAEPPEPS